MSRSGIDESGTPRLSCTHVIGALAAGGAERFVVDLVCALKEAGRPVDLLVLSNRRDEAGDEMARRLGEAGISFECGPTARVRIRTVAWYVRKLRARGSRIIHLHTTNTEMIHLIATRISRSRPKAVRTIHNTVLPSRGFAGFAFRKLPVDFSIGCGDVATDRHASAVPGPVLSIPNGVQFEWDIRNERGAPEARRLLGLDSRCRHFVSIARMSGQSAHLAQKGHDLLIRAWRAGECGRDATLHLIGDGELRPQLEALVGDDASIRFEGVRNDIPQWLQAADGFILTSRWEGLPIAGIEAVGSGLPCFFSDIPSFRELEAPCAVLVETEDEELLAVALARFVSSSSFPSHASTMEFRNRFAIERVAERYEEVYRKLDSRPH